MRTKVADALPKNDVGYFVDALHRTGDLRVRLEFHIYASSNQPKFASDPNSPIRLE